MSKNEIFDFLTSNSTFFSIFVDGGSMTNAKVYQGFHDDKRVEGHCSRSITRSQNYGSHSQSMPHETVNLPELP